MDDSGPAEAPMLSKRLQKWQEKPKLAVAQQSHQILPIKGWESEGEYPAPEIRNSQLMYGDPDRRGPGPPGWGWARGQPPSPGRNILLKSQPSWLRRPKVELQSHIRRRRMKTTLIEGCSIVSGSKTWYERMSLWGKWFGLMKRSFN